jgi:chromosome segregation ATPase
LKKLPELEKKTDELFKDKANLLEQVRNLTTELGQARSSNDNFKQELAVVTKKMQQLTTDNEALKTENRDHLTMQSKMQDESKTSLQAVSILNNENTTLRSRIEDLEATQAAPAVGGPQTSDKEKKDLQEQVRGLEEKRDGLEKALNEWTELAKVRL